MIPLPLNESVYALCTHWPELKEIMAELGFTDIIKPGMLTTVGRFMTLPKGAALRKLDMELVKDTLRRHGFEPME